MSAAAAAAARLLGNTSTVNDNLLLGASISPVYFQNNNDICASNLTVFAGKTVRRRIFQGPVLGSPTAEFAAGKKTWARED